MKALTQITALAALLLVLAAAAVGVTTSDRNALRRIVTQCLTAYHQRGSHGPCEQLIVPRAGDESSGYVILKDRKPGAHFLLIPIRPIAGIESPELLDARTTNYVAAAWKSRDVLERWLGRHLPRDTVGLAINPQFARGQDQLHIHLECVGPTLYRTLNGLAEPDGTGWIPVWIASRRYLARRISEVDLEHDNPLRLPAEDIADAPKDRGAYTLIVVGRSFAAGPGFVVLAGMRTPGGEGLLDASCSVASSVPLSIGVQAH